MKIANPMYDVVFKYLVEDNDCAKLLLGELIQKEILVCELLHNEIATEVSSDASSGVLKMDFKALIKTGEGKQLLVIIEVQKVLKETNLLRFRQYLGSQYTNKSNYYIDQDKKIPYPIFPIYILGYNIGVDNTIPIIKVKPTCYDYTMGNALECKSLFIESLNHEMIIVQTRVLKNAKRSLLETFLSNFQPEVQQFLEVNPKNFDRKYVSLLKRLEEATMKKEIVEIMQRENLLQEEWEEMVMQKQQLALELENKRKQLEEESRKLEQENRKLQEESRKLEEESRKLEEESRKLETESKLREIERIQKEEERRKKEEILKVSVCTFFELGLSKEIISEKLGIPVSKVEELL